MESLKSPGLDGFHPIFFKSQLNTIGVTLHQLMVNCFLDPNHIDDVDNTSITLIPKRDDSSMVNRFRLITLFNVIVSNLKKFWVRAMKAEYHCGVHVLPRVENQLILGAQSLMFCTMLNIIYFFDD
jgi:hypothetical protein